MSDMTAEERATRLFNAARASAAEDPIFYEFICNQIREAEQAAAAQAQAGVDALAEEIIALREDLEKARGAWHEFPDKAPPPHKGVWHVYRQGVGFFYATVFYGMHAPWWVPQYAERGKPGMPQAQGEPVAMHEGDLWKEPLDPAAIRARSTD